MYLQVRWFLFKVDSEPRSEFRSIDLLIKGLSEAILTKALFLKSSSSYSSSSFDGVNGGLNFEGEGGGVSHFLFVIWWFNISSGSTSSRPSSFSSRLTLSNMSLWLRNLKQFSRSFWMRLEVNLTLKEFRKEKKHFF